MSVSVVYDSGDRVAKILCSRGLSDLSRTSVSTDPSRNQRSR